MMALVENINAAEKLKMTQLDLIVQTVIAIGTISK